KIVCRKPAGTVGFGRATYSHLLAFGGEALELGSLASSPSGPDVLPEAGTMSFSRAMGLAAARLACTFLRDATATRVVVDPFCGQGGVLAVANAMGFDAIGIDLSARRCRSARKLVVTM
ncbi:MAG: SAM-dependent methyltransferase, partial [Myxococcales bacterium]|nr:SAM-dependent methyltransferase [Myxococcales bacterium]